MNLIQFISRTLPCAVLIALLDVTGPGIIAAGNARTPSLLDTVFAPQIPASCPQFPALNAPGVLCENFDTERNGVAGFQFTRLPIGISALDPLLAFGDLNDDVLGYTQSGAASPAGTGARTCATGNDGNFATCTAAVAEENDWHLHSPTEGPGAGYDPLNQPGIGAPDGGKAHSGTRSMHWGRHLDPASTLGDTSRFRQISAFVLDPAFNLGPASTMEFWHIITVPDDENLGNGFMLNGITFAGGQAQISLLGANGRFQRWRRLNPSTNGYDSRIQEGISICEFDPGDDVEPPANDSMCQSSPLWADIGDVVGTDATCTTDTDSNDYLHKDCGDTTSRGPGYTENGALGTGVWAKSVLDLSPFAGRQARIRFIASQGGGWSFATSRSLLEPVAGGVPYQYFDADDGWWIDDVILTDLRTDPSPCTPDGDGDGIQVCDGDCDDADPTIYPGAPAICDQKNNDCNDPDWPVNQSEEEVDDDQDDYSECEGDCDDRLRTTYPGAVELCDGFHNNCSDPGWQPGTPPGEANQDHDGYRVCSGDCDDIHPDVYPGADQICDGVNNNCSDPTWPAVPSNESDADADTFRVCAGDCDDAKVTVKPGGAQICGDGLNNNCTHPLWPSVFDEHDGDGDGFTECQGDCNDSTAATRPGAPEICDGTYNDCSAPGWNPGVPPAEADGDGDGARVCSGDCDDTRPAVYPGAPQQCDGVNNDCSDPSWPAPTSEEFDVDGDTWTVCEGDCDDTRINVRPGGSQVCYDGLNNDCGHPMWPSLALTNEGDDDGDGFNECEADCADDDPIMYSNAPEVNNGLDDQCPGGGGYGLLDEIDDGPGFDDMADPSEFCWTAQSGATDYLVARSDDAVFSDGCDLLLTGGSNCHVDTAIPAPGAAYFFLVRAESPHQGSWGWMWFGIVQVERTGICTAPVCGNNRREQSEVCDRNDLAGQTCVSLDLGFEGGILACEPDCASFDTSRCTY